MNKLTLFTSILLIIQFSLQAQNIGINTSGATPDNSAMLDVVASDKGILIPRVNIADLATAAPITAPATSLLVYNTNGTTGTGYYFWDGSKWPKIMDSNANSDDDWYKANTTNSPTNINDAIFTNGNVGIGLNNPSQALDINAGHIEIDYGYGLGTNVGSATDEWIIYTRRSSIHSLNQLGSVAPSSVALSLESDGMIAYVETDNDDLVGYMDLNANTFIWDGKIGIGTESPGAQLTVKGDARIRLDNSINNQWDLNVDNTDGRFAIEQLTNLVSDGNRLIINTNGEV